MNKQSIIESFSSLGDKLEYLIKNKDNEQDFLSMMHLANVNNQWFSEDNIISSIQGITKMLKKDELERFLANYDQLPVEKAKNIAVIMAGNIPLVGFHDYLCVLLSGNKLYAKMSSKDNVLLSFINKMLIEIEPEFENMIVLFGEHIKLKNYDIDAIIATGSSSSTKHFEYYFKDYKTIIRSNRSSLAVLDGNETEEDYIGLAEDISLYFGLGCRNVNYIFIPKELKIETFLDNITKHLPDLLLFNKYKNNYDYYKSIFLINRDKFWDNEKILVQASTDLNSPVSVLNFNQYNDVKEVESFIDHKQNDIQCVCTNQNIRNAVKFGQAQSPDINDFADGIDTMKFLGEL